MRPPCEFFGRSGNGRPMPLGLTLPAGQRGKPRFGTEPHPGLRPYLRRRAHVGSPTFSVFDRGQRAPCEFLAASGNGRRMPWGLTLPSKARREAPVRTEPHPTSPFALHRDFQRGKPRLGEASLYFLAKTLHNIYLSRQRCRRSADVEKRR
jgi:hypothetical protein